MHCETPACSPDTEDANQLPGGSNPFRQAATIQFAVPVESASMYFIVMSWVGAAHKGRVFQAETLCMCV